MTDFVCTTAIERLLMMRKRVRIVQGGTSAGKTYGILAEKNVIADFFLLFGFDC